MNKVCLTGRLTANPELVANSNGINYCRFCLAVNRNYTNENGEREADFISCVAWRERAELICRTLKKGSHIALEGHIQTGHYDDKDGKRIYTTDVITDNITFLDSKKDSRPEPEYTGPVEQEEETESDPFADFGQQVEVDDNYLE